MVKKFLLIICCFVLLSIMAFGQSRVVFQNSENTTITNTYVANPDENQKITNYYIYEIARSIPKKTEFTQYIFNCIRTHCIYETGKGEYSSSFAITDVDCSGDITYKGFSVADALIPSYCSYTFSVFSDKPAPLYQKVVTDGQINVGYNIMASYNFSDTASSKKFSTRVDNFAFHYDEKSKQHFAEKLKLIDDYFMSEATIDQCFKKVGAIDFNNTDMIIVYDISLKEAEKTAEEIYSKDFAGKLNLVSYDPVHFIDKYNELSEKLYNTRFQLNQKLKNLDKLYYERGKEELTKNEKAKAEVFFNRSVLYNPDFAPSQLELARLYYDDYKLNDAADKLSYILHNLNPVPDVFKQVILFTDTVYNKMLETGNDHNKAERYNEAIEIFEKCVSFCKDLPRFDCGERHMNGLATARFGIYQSYLTVSQKAIDNGKLELAEIYISDARNYQKQYSNFIINDAEALSKLEKIMMIYVARGDTLISKGNYDKGLSFLEKAKNISEKNKFPLSEKFGKSVSKARAGIYKSLIKKCVQLLTAKLVDPAENKLNEAIDYQKQYSEFIAPVAGVDSLMAKIKYLRYNDFISTGILAQTMRNPESALQHYDQAFDLEQKYFFRRNNKLDSLRRAAAQQVITGQLDIAEKFVVEAKTDSAVALAARIMRGFNYYDLSNDTVLSRRAGQLKNDVFRLRCGRAKQQFDELRKQGDIAVARQDFITSDSLYTKAITVGDSLPDCMIDVDLAIDGKKKYIMPGNYQRMMASASQYLMQHIYNLYFQNYTEAENFYKNAQIGTYGLMHQMLVDKVSVSEDTAFILSGADFFIQKSRPEDVLQCLKTLKKLNYPAVRSKSLQLQSGALLARKDHEVNASASPAVLVVSYTGNDKWFSYFKSSYVKTWKALNK